MQVCKKEEDMGLALSAFAGALSTVQKGLVANKIANVQAGTKTVNPPKTQVGKLLGKLTGRTQASEIQEEMNKQSLTNQAVQSGFPISGGVNFGGQATRNTWLPFAIVAVLGLLFFSPFKKRRRR